MKDIEKIKEKFEDSVLKNLDKENFNRIVEFLIKENCDYIEDIICDYLDLFNFKYEEFVVKYNKINQEFNGTFLKQVSEDMNLLEEFYNIKWFEKYI